MSEPDWDAVRDEVAASIRAEVLILSCTPGITGAAIVSAAFRGAKAWAQGGIDAYRSKNRPERRLELE
jgi:hypothetical protein